ncbi:TonB-dependent receptor [Sphingobium nicotianae]|uniref:TonB-dependent receptor n=1 Tax=Sphingobium nicotianae TaxID=2782607 RepID=A0A9X1IPC7_9SPHN|nr:TonB-dependent receptor [Sphingobium nicotianae]MBT2186088.1 TonB-dependent receptor [Sphingobium nicotianae]
MRRSASIYLSSVAVIAQLCLAAPIHAQTADAAEAVAAEEDVGEIIVTAQKRSERLQDVPVAITAVTGDALLNRGIADTKNLTQVAPSLTFGQGNNPNNSSFRVRGIGTSVFGIGSEASVSVVMDGVVMARGAQGFADLADIERIEVLRGPQGTLFGKNATAGVISVVTARPSKTLSGSVNASVAEMGEYRVNGTVSAPISDVVGVRLSGFYNNDDGYYYNVAQKKKINGFESWGVRGKLEFDLGDLNLLGMASYSENNGTCCQSALIRSDNANLSTLIGPVVARPFNREVVSNGDNVSRTNQAIFSLEGSYDLGAATITSLTAYQKYNFYAGFDVDGINNATPIYTGGNGLAPYYANYDVNAGPFDLKQFSQELRLASSGSNRFNYVVGLYYDQLTGNRSFGRRIVTCPTSIAANQGLALGATCPSPRGSSGSANSHLEATQYAAFGQIDYRLVGGLKAIAGIRVQHQSLWVYGAQDVAPLVVGDTPMFSGATLTSGRTDASDDAVTGRAGLQYEFNRHAQAYATFSHGYKGQSLGTEFNQTFNNNAIVEPETVNAYEIGFKGSTSNRVLTVAIAAFLADYKNLQVQANKSDNSTGTFLFVVTNAGTSQTKGIEIETTLRPTEELSIQSSFAYVHGRFDANGLACPLNLQAAAVTVPFGGVQPNNTCFRQASSTGTLSGNQQNVRNGILPVTPEWRFSINPRYEKPVSSNMIAYVDLNFAWQSKVNFALEQDQLAIQKAYATLDATIGIRPADKGLRASIWVKNAFDQNYYSSLGRFTTLTSNTVTPNNILGFMPKSALRYFGASIGYSF